MNKELDKIYCFVDESGQHTRGKVYCVAAVIVNTITIRDAVEQKLIGIERNVKKGAAKWKSTRDSIREDYLRSIANIQDLKGCLYFAIHFNTIDYINATVDTITQAINQHIKKTCQVIIVIDGLDNKSKQRISRRLKERGILYKKVSGIKDEGSAWIRLADAIAGFSRQASENRPYTLSLYPEMKQKGFLTQL